MFNVFIFFFFFFKQKTAYEILASDWSSDVCSSDLFTPRFFAARATDKPIVSVTSVLSNSFNWNVPNSDKIGRASCRERV